MKLTRRSGTNTQDPGAGNTSAFFLVLVFLDDGVTTTEGTGSDVFAAASPCPLGFSDTLLLLVFRGIFLDNKKKEIKSIIYRMYKFGR